MIVSWLHEFFLMKNYFLGESDELIVSESLAAGIDSTDESTSDASDSDESIFSASAHVLAIGSVGAIVSVHYNSHFYMNEPLGD